MVRPLLPNGTALTLIDINHYVSLTVMPAGLGYSGELKKNERAVKEKTVLIVCQSIMQ